MKKIVIILFVIMFTIISTNIVFAASVREDTIDGEFNGWEGETVVKNLSINNFPISLPESDEGSSQMRESQVS